MLQQKLPSLRGIRFLFVLSVTCLLAVAFRRAVTAPVSIHPAVRETGKGTVVMELFTSQGCSSCPPADALLAQYAASGKTNIIPLAFHVDYWNRLGWTDPFSSAANSERQQWYGRYLTHGEIYTPMMIINGKAVAVGNNASAVKEMVDQASGITSRTQLITESIHLKEQTVEYNYEAKELMPGAQILVALVQKNAVTKIGAGENRGVNLANVNIVRNWQTAELRKSGMVTLRLPLGFTREGYRLVAFVQEKDLQITAASMANIP
ncbi:MAG TPA: DUF1223 domain-containing protein [Sediminibacterium sp.]|nr:DUF1223 domain-containing protein [Sediminibacterium sp.]